MIKSDRANCNTRKGGLSNQAAKDPHVAEVMGLITKAITKAKAVTLIKLLPFLPVEHQTVRALAEILGVSYQTVHNWINNYGDCKFEDVKKGGERT